MSKQTLLSCYVFYSERKKSLSGTDAYTSRALKSKNVGS